MRDTDAQAKEDKKDQTASSRFFKYFLLAFAGIALFVGAFVIANTLSITIAQRMREFATLRTLGASRRQVLWSVVIEALVIGVLGSIVGLFLGLGLAKLLNALFVVFGIDLPQGQTVFATRTVVVSLLVGTIVTLVASIRPARRATRVPPIAAVREGSVLPAVAVREVRAGHRARRSSSPAIALVALGALGSGIATGPRLLMLGVGVLLLFFGVSMNAARVVRPLAAVLGAPARAIGGAPGILARDNADTEPGADRFDGVGADDRPRARHLRGDLRAGRLQVVRGRGRPALRRRLRGHGDEHVHADRRRGREVARREARRQRRDADPRGLGPFPRQRPRPHRPSQPNAATGIRIDWKAGRPLGSRPARNATASSPTATTRRASTCTSARR